MTGGIVYMAVNIVNGKKYVGCTVKTLAQRWRAHLREARIGSDLLFHRALRKYGGEGFIVGIVEEVNGTREDLFAAEMRVVAEQGSQAPAGYNMTAGGEGVDFSDEEVRQRHRSAVQQLAKDPKWIEACAEARKALRKDPTWIESCRQAAVRRMEQPGEREKTTEMLRTTMTTDEWKRLQKDGSIRRSQDPTWKAKATARLRTAEMDEKRRAGARRMAADPEWQLKHAAMIAKRNENPKWKAAQAMVRAKAAEARLAKALAIDALCSPEEREARVRRRENDRRRRRGGSS